MLMSPENGDGMATPEILPMRASTVEDLARKRAGLETALIYTAIKLDVALDRYSDEMTPSVLRMVQEARSVLETARKEHMDN